MQALLSTVLFAASALALTNITFVDTAGTTKNMILGDTTSWFDVEGIYDDTATISVRSDTSEVAACYISSNSLTRSKWVLYDPIGGPTEWNGPVKFVYCQDDFGLPEWIGKDAIVSD